MGFVHFLGPTVLFLDRSHIFYFGGHCYTDIIRIVIVMHGMFSVRFLCPTGRSSRTP